MTTTELRSGISDEAKAEARRLSRRSRRRKYRGWALIYLILGFFAIAMIFPFVYMFFTGVKNSSDVFRYPPRVLPYASETIEVNGEERTMVLVETGVEAGLFARETDLETTVAAPLQFATDTGRTVQVEGEELGVYLVTYVGESEELVLLRGTAVGRFVDKDDATIEEIGRASCRERV